MKNIIAVAGALAINVGLVLAFQNSAEDALPVPRGEVTVTELSVDGLPTLAQVNVPEESVVAL